MENNVPKKAAPIPNKNPVFISAGNSPPANQIAGKIIKLAVGESYVNLIPTIEGGTHVNGLRAGITDAVREFCEFRNLVPRGIKLAPEDVWDRFCYVLSVKMNEPQFAGQTKERLASRESAAFVSGLVKDSFARLTISGFSEALLRTLNCSICWLRS